MTSFSPFLTLFTYADDTMVTCHSHDLTDWQMSRRQSDLQIINTRCKTNNASVSVTRFLQPIKFRFIVNTFELSASIFLMTKP